MHTSVSTTLFCWSLDCFPPAILLKLCNWWGYTWAAVMPHPSLQHHEICVKNVLQEFFKSVGRVCVMVSALIWMPLMKNQRNMYSGKTCTNQALQVCRHSLRTLILLCFFLPTFSQSYFWFAGVSRFSTLSHWSLYWLAPSLQHQCCFINVICINGLCKTHGTTLSVRWSTCVFIMLCW